MPDFRVPAADTFESAFSNAETVTEEEEETERGESIGRVLARLSSFGDV